MNSLLPDPSASVLDRIKCSMVGLKMPRAIEVVDDCVSRLDRGEITALEAVEQLLLEELTFREERRIRTALRMGRVNTVKTLAGYDFSFQPSLDKARIVKNELALPMVAPETYTADKEVLARLIHCPPHTSEDAHRILRGWERFDVDVLLGGNEAIDGEQRKMLDAALKLYRRFANGAGPHWNYRHTLLLWLQRTYVWKTFEDTPALPGSDDETPYDFDHIIPANDWSGWTGYSKDHDEDCLPFYRRDRGQPAEQWIGNSIGNVRVWESSDNRSLGKASPTDRLNSGEDRAATIVGYDENWEACESDRKWTRERASAFQHAIETRTFNLYNKLYTDLKFDQHIAHAGISSTVSPQ